MLCISVPQPSSPLKNLFSRLSTILEKILRPSHDVGDASGVIQNRVSASVMQRKFLARVGVPVSMLREAESASVKRQRQQSSDTLALPPEMVCLIGMCMARSGTQAVCLRARLVSQEWNSLVLKYARPAVWCNRLLTRVEEWPHDDAFPFRMWPGFALVVLRHHRPCFGWPHFFELARRMLEAKSDLLASMEAHLWHSEHMSQLFSEAHAGHTPPYLCVTAITTSITLLSVRSAPILTHAAAVVNRTCALKPLVSRVRAVNSISYQHATLLERMAQFLLLPSPLHKTPPAPKARTTTLLQSYLDAPNCLSCPANWIPLEASARAASGGLTILFFTDRQAKQAQLGPERKQEPALLLVRRLFQRIVRACLDLPCCGAIVISHAPLTRLWTRFPSDCSPLTTAHSTQSPRIFFLSRAVRSFNKPSVKRLQRK